MMIFITHSVGLSGVNTQSGTSRVAVLPLLVPVVPARQNLLFSLSLSNHVTSRHIHIKPENLLVTLQSSDHEMFSEGTVHLQIYQKTIYTHG